MDFVYAILWFVVAIILVVRFRKEGKIIWLISGLFTFMGAWWLADALMTNIDLMDGIYAWIFRGIVSVFLCIGIVIYLVQKRKNKS